MKFAEHLSAHITRNGESNISTTRNYFNSCPITGNEIDVVCSCRTSTFCGSCGARNFDEILC
ncbi:hypothetical protein NQ317_008629 [Molorchus minor]|uniref:Uncharacterized protein n=1 Tax=Molorchus minor TaxID=1323400 RepID=A0ABQ9IZ86_9CUCU|nr:hypothetical protein NQ317_008629 [Molorchus minor]